jgi:hypothetical protein
MIKDLKMQTRIDNVRLSFEAIFTAKSFESEKPAFSASFILDSNHPQLQHIRDVTDQVGQDKWKDKWPGMKAQLEAQSKVPLKDGDMKAIYEGYAGNYFITARSPVKPAVVDTDRTKLTGIEGKPYNGCYVNALIEIWAQDNRFGKRINCKLLGVQFAKDGDAFGAGVAANEDDFEVLNVANLI